MALNPETLPSEVTTETLMASVFSTNTASNTAGVDISDYIGKLKVTLVAGPGTDNNQAANVTLETGAEANANFAAFDPAKAFTAIIANAAATTESLEVDTRVAGKYLRAMAVRAAAGNGRAITVTLTGKKQSGA